MIKKKRSRLVLVSVVLSVPLASIIEGAETAFGSDGFADELAELDEDFVEWEPVFPVYYLG